MFVERNGLLVIEAESAASLPGDWKTASTTSRSRRIDDPDEAAGGDFIVWEGQTQHFNNPGVDVITYPIEITTPGLYRFEWRSQVGDGGDDTTLHNDSWLKINADQFYGYRARSDSYVHPRDAAPGTYPAGAELPEGSSRDGWFKVYHGTQDWNWGGFTNDGQAHEIFAVFDAPGVYEIQIAARSSSHVIDRMVLHHVDAFEGDPRDLSLPASEFSGASGPPPAAPPPEPIPEVGTVSGVFFVDADGDGQRSADGAEPGVGASVVRLFQDGVVVDRATTSADGAFQFDDVAPGDGYTLRFRADGDATFAVADGQSVGEGGRLNTATFALNADQTVTQNASLAPSALGAISGRVVDENGAGVSAARLALLDANGDSIAATMTAPDGAYSFELLVAGDYRVRALEADVETPAISVAAGETSVPAALTVATAEGGFDDGPDYGPRILGDAAANRIEGTNGDDDIVAAGGPDTVNAAAGDDRVSAGAGADHVLAGLGDDLVLGAGGGDLLKGGAGDDEVRGGAGADRLLGEDGDDLLIGGGGDDFLSGRAGDDVLSGRKGDDILLGNLGVDRLDGGRGDDRLTGGDGADAFVFQGAFGADTITDFTIGVDTIELTNVDAEFASLDVAQSARGAVITVDDQSITLEGVDAASFSADDVVLG